MTFALDCCEREAIDRVASTGGYDSSAVLDVMLGAVEKRFGNQLPEKSIQWQTENGSAYVAHETRWFAKELNLEPCTTAVSSPQSNGMAERFVKTMNSDYINFIPKPDVRTALINLTAVFEHYRAVPWDTSRRGNTRVGSVHRDRSCLDITGLDHILMLKSVSCASNSRQFSSVRSPNSVRQYATRFSCCTRTTASAGRL